MKIIEDKYNIYPRKVTCNKCTSRIELENGKDIIVHRNLAGQVPHYIYSEEPYIYQWKCPLCGEFNKINF